MTLSHPSTTVLLYLNPVLTTNQYSNRNHNGRKQVLLVGLLGYLILNLAVVAPFRMPKATKGKFGTMSIINIFLTQLVQPIFSDRYIWPTQRLCSFRFHISLDIVLKCTDSKIMGKYQSLSLTELVIFGLEDGPDGNCFPLVKTSPGCWKVEGLIEL